MSTSWSSRLRGAALWLSACVRAASARARRARCLNRPNAVAAYRGGHDHAEVICFLASRDAELVTGVTIDATGGNRESIAQIRGNCREV